MKLTYAMHFGTTVKVINVVVLDRGFFANIIHADGTVNCVEASALEPMIEPCHNPFTSPTCQLLRSHHEGDSSS